MKHGAHGCSDSVLLFMLCVVPLTTQEVSIEFTSISTATNIRNVRFGSQADI